ncbi:hypothetical protein ACFQFC_11450 [Amorphoplanes digitatis]|uniref:Uncharacterized protein n=1 Tax=Actinoplanes digitatis TaxID=1868 RepID=A0A7W7I1L3_9ACTN|nr:hypothetical protein [Actinoplanes digitatis]MBB4764816.1 hypothetical protein [Actinoplanes digitatis]
MTFRFACAASAAACAVAFSVPAQAASGYRSLTAAKLKKVVAAVAFPDSSKTEVLATARAGDLGVGAICGAAFPAGQAAYHLVENADGADRAVVIVNQTPGVSPVAYADGVRTGTCDSGVNRIRVKGLPAGAVAVKDGAGNIPFVAVVPRGRVVFLVRERAISAMVRHAASATAAYDSIARS